MSAAPVTDREARALVLIGGYRSRHGRGPSFGRVGEELGLDADGVGQLLRGLRLRALVSFTRAVGSLAVTASGRESAVAWVERRPAEPMP